MICKFINLLTKIISIFKLNPGLIIFLNILLSKFKINFIIANVGTADLNSFVKKLFIYNTNEFYDVYPIKNIIYSITNEYLLNNNKILIDNDKHTNKFLHDNIQDTNYTHYRVFCTLEDLKKLLLEKMNILEQNEDKS
jgi:hypothetical protein